MPTKKTHLSGAAKRKKPRIPPHKKAVTRAKKATLVGPVPPIHALPALLPEVGPYSHLDSEGVYFHPDFDPHVPIKNKRVDAELKVAMVNYLLDVPHVAQCREHFNVPAVSWYAMRNRCPLFKLLVEAARDLGMENLEDEAYRRAVQGVNKGVWHQGERVGDELVYSDGLLSLLLKARRPERFTERTHTAISGKDGGPIEILDAKVTLNTILIRHTEVERRRNKSDSGGNV